MITITENAADHIRKFLTKRGKGEGIRIGVKTSGCSGMAYTLEFVDEIQPDDQVFEQDGVKVFIDPKSMVYLDGTQVDFAKEGLQEGFKFENPNAKESCGCGESLNALNVFRLPLSCLPIMLLCSRFASRVNASSIHATASRPRC